MTKHSNKPRPVGGKTGPLGGAIALLLALLCSAPAASAVTIDFDYTYDVHGLFDAPERRELLATAAAGVNRFIDRLEPIIPSTDQHWEYYIWRPDDYREWEFIADDTIPADTVKIYVGGANLIAPGTNAVAYMAQLWSVSGTTPWSDTVAYRGVANAAAEPATDFAPFAGSLVYNMNRDWHFGLDTAGLTEEKTDFLTVTMHELVHLLGLGPAASGRTKIVDAQFTGEQAVEVGSNNNPELRLDGGSGGSHPPGHWESGTLGGPDADAPVALLTPYTPPGVRRWPTLLDRAALRDIGWREAAPGDVDLDRDVDAADIKAILLADKFGKGPTNATWAEGDFNGDQKVSSADIKAVLLGGLFGRGPYAGDDPHEALYGALGEGQFLPPADALLEGYASLGEDATVPEPGTLLMLAVAALCGCLARRRRSGP